MAIQLAGPAPCLASVNQPEVTFRLGTPQVNARVRTDGGRAVLTLLQWGKSSFKKMKSNPYPVQLEKRTCNQMFWAVFPHACFICSLVIYALLGALMFSHVEGNRESNESEEYKEFMLKLWNLSKDLSENETSNEIFKKRTHELISSIDFVWFSDPKKKWSFLGSLFFCCTVFTTVGYGHTYPVTKLGKYLCMLYALFGIPLMFLVLTDMGDVLASILSMSYNKARQLQSKILTRLSHGSCCKQNRELKPGSSSPSSSSSSSSFRQTKIVLREPLNIKEVLSSHSSFQRKPGQLQNVEIFERLIARENQFLAPPKPTRFERWSSCPELDTGTMMNHMIDNIDNIGKEVEKLDVPFLLMTVIVFAYISCAAAILPRWESDLDFDGAFYFCFITITTIGFGDVSLKHPNFFLFLSFYIVVGMEIVTIAFKLGQDRLLGLYKKMICCIGRKNAPHKMV
ncbi:potassium channel subfamily K member 18 [Elgaria multicarinata webbii]|uniref:potassium channel subfamily K member 18 n=1 Tax=Elgaria multicarinata webbii TaxID=159646 RepID=UPI002FCCE7EA